MRLERRLKLRHDQVQTRMRQLEASKVELLDVVLEALAAGHSYQSIADILDLSKSRVQQLARQATGRDRTR